MDKVRKKERTRGKWKKGKSFHVAEMDNASKVGATKADKTGDPNNW